MYDLSFLRIHSKRKKNGIILMQLNCWNFQAFLEHGIPETPEMVVALMQKVRSVGYC